MSLNAKLQLKVFTLVLALVSMYFIYEHRQIFVLGNFLYCALIAAVLYVLSHFLRAIRLRFMIASADFSTNDALAVQFGSAALGNLLYPLIKDLLAVYLFILINKTQWEKIIISLLYLRFFDFLVITPLILILAVSESAERQGLAMIFFILMLAIFLLLILLPRLCKLVIDYLIKYSHTNKALYTVRFLARLKEVYASMNLNSLDKAFMILLFTISAWLLELMAIWIFSSQAFQANFSMSYFYLLANVLTNIPFIGHIELPVYLYTLPYMLFLVVSTVILLLRSKKGE